MSSSLYRGKLAIENISILLEIEEVVLNYDNPPPKLYTIAIGTKSRVRARKIKKRLDKYLWNSKSPSGLIAPFLPRYFSRIYSY